MGPARRIEPVSIEDYLVGERDAEVRHEYVDGELFAMVGASRSHNLLATNLSRALGNALAATPCRVTVSDMKVRPPAATRFYYPDVMVSCSDIEDEPDEYFETSPALVVEIMSDSTEAIDRREKRLAYATIESLEEYVLVAQDSVSVELYRRDGDGGSRTTLGPGDTLSLVLGGGADIALDALYEGVPLLGRGR